MHRQLVNIRRTLVIHPDASECSRLACYRSSAFSVVSPPRTGVERNTRSKIAGLLKVILSALFGDHHHFSLAFVDLASVRRSVSLADARCRMAETTGRGAVSVYQHPFALGSLEGIDPLGVCAQPCQILRLAGIALFVDEVLLDRSGVVLFDIDRSLDSALQLRILEPARLSVRGPYLDPCRLMEFRNFFRRFADRRYLGSLLERRYLGTARRFQQIHFGLCGSVPYQSLCFKDRFVSDRQLG